MRPVNSTHEALIDAGNQTPIYRVKVYETAKTVPSKGFNVAFYTLPDKTESEVNAILNDGGISPYWYENTDVTAQLSGSDIIEESTIMAFDWGIGGSPAPVSRAHLWGARWYGKFFARYSGVYTFYIDACSFGHLRVKIDGTYLTFKNADGTDTDKWYDDYTVTTELYADTGSLTAGSWYDIQIEFAVGRKLEEWEEATYLCVKYKEPTATSAYDVFGETGGDVVTDYVSDDDEKKVLSAGVVNTTASFLSGTEITDIIQGISGGGGVDEAAQYEFKVPIAVTTWLTGDVTSGETTLPVDSTNGFPVKGKLLVDDVEVTYTGKTSNAFTGCSGVTGFSEDDRVTLHAGKYSFNPNTRDFGVLRPFRLCSIEFGHRNSSGTAYYCDAVWGHIYPNPVVHRTQNEAYLTIYVQDFTNLLQIPMANYPDNASYSAAGYYSPIGYSETRNISTGQVAPPSFPSTDNPQDLILYIQQMVQYNQIKSYLVYIGGLNNEPEGLKRPVCYDRWNCEKAVRDLYMKANIDPVLLYQRKRLAVTGGYTADYGGYLINADFTLNHRPRYGNPDSVENPDDQYLWFFGYGTKVIEALTTFAKTFGRRIGFTNEGFAKFLPLGLPTTTVDVNDATPFVTKTDHNDFGATYNHYQESSTAGEYIEFSVTGSQFTILAGRHSSFGSVKIEVDGTAINRIYMDGQYINGVGGVFDLDFAGRDSTDPWLYFDGIYAGTGENPAEVRIVDEFTYGSHTIKITIDSSDTGTVFIDGIQCFDRAIDHSVKDITTSMVLDNLDSPYDIENVRNDILVIGALIGLFQNSDQQVINPNNPIYRHIYSRAVDVYSIYDSSNKHYVGRRIPFQIWDSKINSQEWADYISANSIKKYRPMQFKPPVTVPMDMRLEPDDCVTVYDLKTKTTLDSDNLWITNVKHNYTKSNGKIKAVSTIQTTPLKPLRSFERREAIDINTDYNDEPIINIELKSQGKRISGTDINTTDLAAGSITIDTDPGWTTNMWQGYIFTIYGDNGTTTILNDKIASNTSNTVTLETLDLTNFTFTGNLMWSISFDPFDTDNANAPLEIHYDQLVNGRVRVYIKDSNDTLVAFVNKSTADDIVEWGSGKVVYWSGVNELNNNYYVSNHDFYNESGNLVRPLYVYFEVENIDSGSIYAVYSKVSDDYHGGIIREGVTEFDTLINSNGCAIFPFNRYAPPIAYLDTDQGSDIIYSGQISGVNRTDSYFILDNDPGVDLTGKLMVVAQDNWYNTFKITGTYSGDTQKVTVDTLVPFSVDSSGVISGILFKGIDESYTYHYYAIYDSDIHPYFDHNDNSFKGLNLKVVTPSLYIDGDVELTSSGTELNSDFNLIYEGTTYSFLTGHTISLCNFRDNENLTGASYCYIIYFWNKHNPTQLYRTYANAESSPWDNQSELYEVIQRVNRPRDGLYVLFVAYYDQSKPVYCIPTEEVNYTSGFNVSVVKQDYTIYKTKNNDYRIEAWNNQDETLIQFEDFPKIATLEEIYYNPENTGLSWKALPEDEDAETNVAQFFTFNLDLKDRAGRSMCNMFISNYVQEFVPAVRKLEDDFSFQDSWGKIKPLNTKTDELIVSWYPLGLTGTDYILPTKQAEKLSTRKKLGIEHLYQKMWT